MILTVNGVTKKRAAFEPLSFTLQKGEGILLRGKNGVGKTTLLDIIAGIIKPDTGLVQMFGSTVPGYAMQNPGFYEDLSCYDNLVMEAELVGLGAKKAKAAALQAAEECLCKDFLKKSYKKLSSGMKAKVSIAAALLCDPQLILLDEPFNAIDVKSEEILRMVIKKYKDNGSAVVIAAHGGDYGGLCERTVQL